MTLLPRPNPKGETCPFCLNKNSLETTKSYSSPMGDGTFRNADCIECNRCKMGFWVGWISELQDGVIMQPIGGL